MADNSMEKLGPGDHVMPDGRIHHVLNVQKGTIDMMALFQKIEKNIENKLNTNKGEK